MANTTECKQVTVKISELFRPNFDRAVGGRYRGNHTGYHVGITREGDSVRVDHAWNFTGWHFNSRESESYSIKGMLKNITDVLDLLPDGEECSLNVIDDLHEGFSTPEWR